MAESKDGEKAVEQAGVCRVLGIEASGDSELQIALEAGASRSSGMLRVFPLDTHDP